MKNQITIDDWLKTLTCPSSPEPEPDKSHCEGCQYYSEGEYKVGDWGFTWKYGCPGTASAKPNGTPMNVSAPLIEHDGHYYDDNIVDGVPHIMCWKKAGARRYINRFQAKQALEAVIGEMNYVPMAGTWNRTVNKYMFSFDIDLAAYENQNTKVGDDIISVSVCRPNGTSFAKACDSIDEAVKVFELYYDQAVRICLYSNHECNKEELWRIADSLDETQCPHVCCRKCTTKSCGARCNGAPEPKEYRQWFRLCKHEPEASGCYEIIDVNGTKGRAWYEKGRGFDHVTGHPVECWRKAET